MCIALAFVVGCPPISTPSSGDTTGDDTLPDSQAPDASETVTGRINTALSSVSLSIDDPAISILYTVTGLPNTITGFFIPVSDNGPSAVSIGEPTQVAAGLPATGANTSFLFFPSAAGVGFFRVGIMITVDSEEIEALSDGVIEVQGPPDPCFVQPCKIAAAATPVVETYTACNDVICDLILEVDLEVTETITVAFDAGDPENLVQWRLFYLLVGFDTKSNPADQLGTEILTGSTNIGLIEFLVTDLAVGDYELGISATDSGLSVVGTVDADGDDGRIVTVFGPIVRILP